MSERVLENVCFKINIIIDKCIKNEINMKEAQTEIVNVMNVILDEYNELISIDYINKIHILLSKIIFSKNIEMIVMELNNLNNIMKKIILELTDISQKIDWYDEVKRRIVQRDMFMSELMVSIDLEYEKRIIIFKKYIMNEIRINNGNNHKEIVDTIR